MRENRMLRSFDEAGTGNVIMIAGLRPMTKAMDKPPEPKVRAPVLDPTGGRGLIAFPNPISDPIEFWLYEIATSDWA